VSSTRTYVTPIGWGTHHLLRTELLALELSEEDGMRLQVQVIADVIADDHRDKTGAQAVRPALPRMPCHTA
jgi:hypothetical protein